VAEIKHACAIEEITPEEAKRMLATGNRKNRRLSEPSVRRLEAVIARGEWMPDSTDAIGLAADGSVVNGQHRLEAISRSNVSVRALVVRNVSPDVIKIIDQGMSRNLAQTLQIDGGYTEPGTTATAADWLYNMIGRFEKSRPTEYKPTVPQLLELLAEHPHLTDSLDPAGMVHSRDKHLTKGVLCAYHYAMASADPDMADEFFSQLATGLDVVEYSPVYVLREKYNQDSQRPAEKQMKKWEAAAYLVMAWEASRRGAALSSKQLKVIRSGPRATAVPTVSGVPWLEREGDQLPLGGTDDEEI
jgi:hypothetical protein